MGKVREDLHQRRPWSDSGRRHKFIPRAYGSISTHKEKERRLVLSRSPGTKSPDDQGKRKVGVEELLTHGANAALHHINKRGKQ